MTFRPVPRNDPDSLPARGRMLVALAATLLMAACGGGGAPSSGAGGATAGPAAAPSPAPSPAPIPGVTAPLDARLSVPPPVYGADPYGSARTAAFNRFNETRARAGLGLLTQSSVIDVAAMGHVAWLGISGNPYGHVQTPGSPGFTGVTALARAVAAGYGVGTGGSGPAVGEVIGVGFLADDGARVAVDDLVAAIYHRAVILDPGYVDAGVGVGPFSDTRDRVEYASGLAVLMNLGRPPAVPMGQGVAAGPRNVEGTVVWPVDGATNVQRSNGFEIPAPPGVGFAASVHCHRRDRLDVTTFVVRVAATGTVVPTQLIHRDTDATKALASMPCFAAALPERELDANTTYAVEFSGVIARNMGSTAAGSPTPSTATTTAIRRTWQFTTGTRFAGQLLCADGTYGRAPQPRLGGCSNVPPIP